jgi:hypothetical protein
VFATEENTGNGGSDHLFTEHNAEVCFLKITSEIDLFLGSGL